MLVLHKLSRSWLRSLYYKSVAGSRWHRVIRSQRAVATHETAAFWNGELSGRMSTPNVNGRISNALRDMTSAVLIKSCGPTPTSVLDLGCGFGTLAGALADDGLRRYVGVDLSDYVVDRANRESAAWPLAKHCDVSFRQSDLREFTAEADDTFDVIVFNEVLKYVDAVEAVEQVMRYQRWLAVNGVFCVNITDDPKCHAIFRALNRRLQWVYGTVYQQRPEGPKFRVTPSRATPAYLTGLFRPRTTRGGQT